MPWKNAEGYPGRQLAASTLHVPTGPLASAGRVRENLEKWERRRGNALFEARNLERVPAALAGEYANIWAALREKYPEVRASHVDFAAKREHGTLADAESYNETYPTLRSLAYQTGAWTVAEAGESVEDLEHEDIRVVERELRQAHECGDAHIDVTATGSIALSSCLSHKKCYNKLLRYWEQRNARAIANGKPVRVTDLSVSAACYVFVHEFGHLVDAHLAEMGESATERVYAELSRGLLNLDRRPSPQQWRMNLWNYPVAYMHANPGRYEGSPDRARETKKAMRESIAGRLGTYATHSRDELFAEAFSLSYGAKSSELRGDLAPMRQALVDVGVACARRS